MTTAIEVGAVVAVRAVGRRTPILIEVYETHANGFVGWLLETQDGAMTRARSDAGCYQVASVSLHPRFVAHVCLSAQRDLSRTWGSAGTRLELSSRDVSIFAAAPLRA